MRERFDRAISRLQWMQRLRRATSVHFPTFKGSFMTSRRRRGLCAPLPDDINVKSEYIADQLGISLEDFERYHHLGLVSVRVKREPHLRSGLRHIKVCLGNRLFEAVTDGRGTVLYEALRNLGGTGSSGS